ncbi:MAG: hypothetical protein WCS43_15880, partial [Verrucomicrobiota bacterium]
DGKFAVIRTIRISNTKKDPPRTGDAKFETTASGRPAESNNIFFETPSAPQPPAVPGGAATSGAAPAPAPAPAPPPKTADTGRILAQVLGNEELHVFIRLDFLSFLPAQKLP